MPFLAPQLTQLNIPISKVPTKVKLKPADVTLQFLLAREVKETYKVEFLLNINPKQQLPNPSEPLRFSNIDVGSLEAAIISNIKEYDRKFMILKEFDSFKAVFYFDIDLWLKYACSGIIPKTVFDRFTRVFAFKIQIPRMIAYDTIRMAFPKFIARKFKQYLLANHQMSAWFGVLFPKFIASRIGTAIQDRFDYEYNFQQNAIIMKLQTFWVLVILYATGEFIKILKNKPKEERPKDFFEIKVKNQVVKIDRRELEKVTGKELFV
jgi:hypothetical protein